MTRDWWLELFSQWLDYPAIVEDDKVIAYRRFAASIRETAEGLAMQGIRKHSVVILQSDFSIASVTAFFALVHLGAIVVPIAEATPDSLAVQVQCGAEFLCRTVPGLAIERLAETVQPALYEKLKKRDTSGLVLLSSGSTGTSKAVLHDLEGLLAAQRVDTVKRKVSVVLTLLFDHIGGINTLLRTLFAGGVALIASERTPDAVCRLIEKQRARILPATPTFLNLILIGGFQRLFDLGSLRLISYGTEPMPEDLLRRLHEAFPRARLLQTFGTSETGIALTSSQSSNSTFFKIDDANVSYRIVNGELQLRSATRFLGYLYSDSESTADDEWFRTGDIVESSGDGFIRIRGRVQEVINVGGQKILPVELETMLLQSPMIADCQVHSEPNALTGQIICADIVPRDLAITRSEMRRHIQSFFAGKVEAFKIPTRIKIINQVPYSRRFKRRRHLNHVDLRQN